VIAVFENLEKGIVRLTKPVGVWIAYSLLVAKPLLAAEPGGQGEVPSFGGLGGASLKMFGSLILVIGVILFLFYVIRRLRLNPLSLRRYPEMHLLETMNLGPRRSVALVEVGGKWLVLGVGAESVTLLSRFDDPPVRTREDGGALGNRESFHSLLRNKILGDGGGRDG
jgi:flagellar biosynthetic protein FliO